MNFIIKQIRWHERMEARVAAGILLLVWWLTAAVSGPRAFAAADWVVRSWIGFIVLTGSAWALCRIC